MHQETKESCGHIRLIKHLQSQCVEISQYAVRVIKKLNQLYFKRHKRFKRTTDSDHNRLVYNNLLKQLFRMSAPDIASVSGLLSVSYTRDSLFLILSFFKLVKKDLAMALSQQFPRRLILGTKLCF